MPVSNTATLVRLDVIDPPPSRLYCPFTGTLIISAEDPLQIESRLGNLSPYLRFVMFYDYASFPALWAANPNMLDEGQREMQEAVIRIWTTAADVGQATATYDGGWYWDYLEKISAALPSSSLLLQVLAWPGRNISSAVSGNNNVHIDLDVWPQYAIAALFVSERPPHELVFRRVRTMWDGFIPEFTLGRDADAKEGKGAPAEKLLQQDDARPKPSVAAAPADHLSGPLPLKHDPPQSPHGPKLDAPENKLDLEAELVMLKAWIAANPPETPYVADKKVLERWKSLPRQQTMRPENVQRIANAFLAEAQQYYAHRAASDAQGLRIWAWLLAAILGFLLLWALFSK